MTSIGQVASAEILPAPAPAAGTEIGSNPAAARSRLARATAYIAIGFALIAALATFLVDANLTPIAGTHEVNIALYATDGIAALLLILISIGDVWQIVQARRRG